MKKMMAVFALLFVSAAVFLAAAFSANAAEDGLVGVEGSNGLKISASAVEGEEDDYTYADGVLTIISNKEMTISGGTDKDHPLYDEVIVVNSPSGANITLRKAYLQVRSGSKFAALKIDEGMSETVMITLEDDNLLKSTTSGYAGLQKNGDSCKLIINGNGKLTAEGGGNGAGIGGAAGKDSGNIEISGSADVTAKGDGAGIGGGNGGDGSNITIGGSAKVDASSTKGAGIGGGGNGGKGSYITIKDTAIVDKASSISGAGIGGGNGGEGSNIIISGGTVTATSNTGAGIGGGDGGVGSDITITGGEITATGSTGAGIGGGQNGKGTRITISGGKINKASANNGPGAGIGGGYNGDGTDITISGDADVTATGGIGGAGIGGGNGGNGSGIKISGGKVHATGGNGGAGIGGGQSGEGTDITISDNAEVTANSGDGAGIGGGDSSNGKRITIEGCKTIEAVTTGKGAGIGGGKQGKGTDIIISGGNEIIATGGNGGAGIGGGGYGGGDANIIKIYGKTKVIAAGAGGAGIGGGFMGNADGIEIYGSANVTATSQGGAGIGGGSFYSGNGAKADNIKIYGEATVSATGTGGAGIGGGSNGAGTDIEIYDSANVTAIGYSSAGIGGGNNGAGTDIKIYGSANVTAASKTYNTLSSGAGIGSHNTSECIITIEGGTVKATSDDSVGIGSTNGAPKVTISGGTVTAIGKNVGIGDPNKQAVVKIKGTNSTDYPWVFTNKIASANYDNRENDDDNGYWGIVFGYANGDTFTDIEDNNFDEGIVYGTNKTVEITDDYTLTAGKTLTVLDNVTFKPGNKFTLDASTLRLNEDATLDKWYEMTKVNGGEIQHVHRSQYEWYDVKDYSFVATDYTTLYKSGDKEGIVLCDICGKPEYHDPDIDDDWGTNETHHWHSGTCEPGLDCSKDHQAITECTYIKLFNGKLDYGEHRYNDEPDKVENGELYFYCKDCHYLAKMVIPTIYLNKVGVDGDNKEPLAGAEFGLYTNAGCTGTPYMTGTTAITDGKAVVSFNTDADDTTKYIKPNTTYYIKEIKAPDGYTLSDKIFTAVVDADGKVTYGDEGSETSPICENTANANEPEEPGDNDSKPAPDDNNSKPAPDDNNDSKPKPDDNDTPNTGVGIGIAGLMLLGGSLCVVSVTKSRRK